MWTGIIPREKMIERAAEKENEYLQKICNRISKGLINAELEGRRIILIDEEYIPEKYIDEVVNLLERAGYNVDRDDMGYYEARW
jgi:hypothetical protein